MMDKKLRVNFFMTFFELSAIKVVHAIGVLKLLQKVEQPKRKVR
jgi:hypothetical protein